MKEIWLIFLIIIASKWENSKEQDGNFFLNEHISNSVCGFYSVKLIHSKIKC